MVLDTMCLYEVKQRRVEEQHSFTFPGANRSFKDYDKCKTVAFEVFCSEYMKHKESNFKSDRHPILDCLDKQNTTYDDLVKKKTSNGEPNYWCPACNWLGKVT